MIEPEDMDFRELVAYTKEQILSGIKKDKFNDSASRMVNIVLNIGYDRGRKYERQLRSHHN
jgi:hypothetical protein